MTQFIGKTKVCYNYNSLNELASLPVKKALIVTNTFMVLTGYAARVEILLGQSGVSCTRFDRVASDLSLSTVKKGILNMEPGTDLIIALGSGSVIDAAKAILFFSHRALDSLTKPLLAVMPTNAGVRSDVTDVSVVTDDNNGIKIPIKDELMIPDLAILDGRFTRTIPSMITATAGMALLAASIEAYTSKDLPVQDYSGKAIICVFKYLVRSFKCCDDIEAREGMLLASCFGGIADLHGGSAIAKILANALSDTFHIHHGRASAIVLPHVMKFNRRESGARYSEISNILGLPCEGNEQGSRSLIYAHEWLCRQIDVPLRVKDLGIDKNQYFTAVKSMTERAAANLSLPNNQQCPREEELEMLLRQLY